ncbi:general substrate transporter [Mycena galopus ATCC 62051]|nr:general substrate transporter [Mycena galopus ATCC 62051]
MFIVGRFFAGAGSWSFLAVTPIYTSEMSPPALRGLFSGMNGIHIALGYALASYMGLAFYFAKDPATQWRGCLGIGLLCPAVMLVITYFIPESPRWLLMKGRVEEARSTVLTLHSSKADPEQEFACQEFSQMKTQADLDKTLNPSWSEMVRRASYRKRVLIAAGFAIIGQSTAVLVINNYGPTLYKSLGFDTKDQLALQCGWLTVSIFGNFFGAVVLDYFGRRPLMLTGLAGCVVALSIEAAIVAEFFPPGTNKAASVGGVFALYLFIVVYAVGVDVAGVTFYSEIFPNHIRAKGVGITIVALSLTDLAYLQASATAFANIGWKYFLLFIVITSIGFVIMCFVLPETKKIPLEEMAKIFGDTEDILIYAAEDVEHGPTLHALGQNKAESDERMAGEHVKKV